MAIPRHIRLLAGALSALLLAISLFAAGPDPSATAPQPTSPAQGAIPAARFAKKVAIITIHRQIDTVMATSVIRRMQLAENGGADAIVFDINTPGGELGAVLDITQHIKASKIPNTVAWVNPTAYSGGAIIALSCREIVVNDPATLGDSLIITLSFGQFAAADEQIRQKFLAPLLAEIVDSARRRGYDESLVQGMVTRGVELWLIRNTKTGQLLFVSEDEFERVFGAPPPRGSTAVPSAAGGAPVDWSKLAPSPDGEARTGVAPSEPFVPAAEGMPQTLKEGVDRSLAGLEYAHGAPSNTARPMLTAADRGQWELVEYVSDGKGVITLKTDRLLKYGLASKVIKNDQELQAFFGATNLVRLDQSWSESLVVVLTNWMVRAVLVVIFLTALFLEMTHPGAILPGSIAAVALFTLIAPPFLNNMASWWEVAAILVGIVCLALEIFILPGFGFFGILGLILLFGGLVGTFTSNAEGLFPDTARGRQDLLHGVLTLALSGVTSGVLLYFVSKHFGSLPIVNRLLLQDTPVASTDDDAGEGLLAAMGAGGAVGAIGAGREGVALTPLRPAGRVQVDDQIIDVVADVGFIPAGARVRIVSMGQFRTTVEQIDGPGPAGGMSGMGGPGGSGEGGEGGGQDGAPGQEGSVA